MELNDLKWVIIFPWFPEGLIQLRTYQNEEKWRVVQTINQIYCQHFRCGARVTKKVRTVLCLYFFSLVNVKL
jgi:hypothetical protein